MVKWSNTRHTVRRDKKLSSELNILRTLQYTVAANLENVEYSGISLNMENSGNSVQPPGKLRQTKVVLVPHSNIRVKQLLTGLTRSDMARVRLCSCYIAGVDVE